MRVVCRLGSRLCRRGGTEGRVTEGDERNAVAGLMKFEVVVETGVAAPPGADARTAARAAELSFAFVVCTVTIGRGVGVGVGVIESALEGGGGASVNRIRRCTGSGVFSFSG